MRAIPFSAFSAVLTPSRFSPSSTSVMATAGCMPTTTVSASRTRAILAMFPSARPMNESTISSAEMSISTPRARCWTICWVSSSWSPMTSLSCISTWMVTSRNSPILRMGIRSAGGLPSRTGSRARHGGADAPEGQDQRVGEGRLGRDAAEVDAQVDDGLGDLGTDPADDALRPHQAGRRHRLQEVLGHQRVDRRHPGDVDDRDRGARVHDALEQALHHHLGPVAVERADERHRQHPLPQRDHRGRELEQVTPLALDHVLARALVDLGGEEAELVEEPGGGPRLAAEPFAVGAVLLAEAGEERLLEREDEGRGL